MRTFSGVVIELGSRGGAFIFHEEYDEFGRLRFARITSHRMHIVGSFIEDLTRTQVLELASSYLHLYLAVQRIHDRVGVMTVNGIYGSRSKVDRDDLDLPAWLLWHRFC